MKLKGNTILITGGTSGIGRAFAEKFLKLGNKVIICGRREERLNELKQKHNELITRVCDVYDIDQRRALAEWTTTNYPETNILINNAGVQYLAELTKEINLEKVYHEVEINFIAPIHLSSLFARHFTGKSEAAIVNITSGLAFSPIAIMPVYCATKAAMHSISLSLRHQLKDTKIKVFEIAPPSVDTELGHDRRADKNQTHGGMDVEEFTDEAFKVLENDDFEAAIGMAENMRQKRELLFNVMNQ